MLSVVCYKNLSLSLKQVNAYLSFIMRIRENKLNIKCYLGSYFCEMSSCKSIIAQKMIMIGVDCGDNGSGID